MRAIKLLSAPRLRWSLIASTSVVGCVGDFGPEEKAANPSLGVPIERPLSSVTTTNVIMPNLPTDNMEKVVLRLSNLAFTAGQKRYFYGKFETTNSANFSVLVGTRIICSSGPHTKTSIRTSRNHEGSTAGKRTIALRWLMHVSVTGTYKCGLMGRANRTPPEEEATLTVIEGPNTALIMEDAPVAGAALWTTPPITIDTGTSPYVLRKAWTATPSATTVDVDGDVQVTTKSKHDTLFSTVQTILYATQLRSDGTGCAPEVTTSKTMTVYHATKHLKFHNSLRGVPISTASSCTRDFALKVRVGVSAAPNNMPIFVDGEPPDTIHYSNGIAIPRP